MSHTGRLVLQLQIDSIWPDSDSGQTPVAITNFPSIANDGNASDSDHNEYGWVDPDAVYDLRNGELVGDDHDNGWGEMGGWEE